MLYRGTCTAALNCTKLKKSLSPNLYSKILNAKSALQNFIEKPLSAFSISHHISTRPARRSQLHAEWRLKDLLQQFPLVHNSRPPHTQTLASLNQHYLVGILSGKIQFVRHHHDGVSIFHGQVSQSVQ